MKSFASSTLPSSISICHTGAPASTVVPLPTNSASNFSASGLRPSAHACRARAIAKDPGLLDAFNKRKAEDPDFAADQRAMLNWFYQHTPYWDDYKDVYPVGKIFDAKQLKKLLKSTEEV